MDNSEEQQSRLQEYTDHALGAPPVEEPPAVCERCGEEPDDPEAATQKPMGRAEHHTGFQDIRAVGDGRTLCPDCRDLDQYLHIRYNALTERLGVVGAVAVFCDCHAEDEVDIYPVHRGDTLADVECSRCESQEVVVEELPPTPTPEQLEVDQ